MKSDSEYLIIYSYAYGDAYITGFYWGDGEDPEFVAYKGTDPLPGKNTKVYKGSYDLDLLTIGSVNDMFNEKSRDSMEWKEQASQSDFDKF